MQLVPVSKVSESAVELTKPSEQGRAVLKSKVILGLVLSIFSKPVFSAVLSSKSANLEQGHLPDICTHDNGGRELCWVGLPNGRKNKD